MPARNPKERALIASLASNRRWGLEPDRRAATAPARAGLLARFEREADPDGQLEPSERAYGAEKLLQRTCSACRSRPPPPGAASARPKPTPPPKPTSPRPGRKVTPAGPGGGRGSGQDLKSTPTPAPDTRPAGAPVEVVPLPHGLTAVLHLREAS